MATKISPSTSAISAMPIAQKASGPADYVRKATSNISELTDRMSVIKEIESVIEKVESSIKKIEFLLTGFSPCLALGGVASIMGTLFFTDRDIAAVSSGLAKTSLVATVIGVIPIAYYSYQTYKNLSSVSSKIASIPNIIKAVKPKEEPPAITDIHAACKKGDLKALEALVNKGADINQEKKGFYPLHIACSKGHLSVVEYLIGKGANVNQYTSFPKYLHTSLSLAYENGHCEVARFLLKKGASPNQTILDGMITPLHLTPKKNGKEIAKLLIKYGASLDSRNGLGRTPLHAVTDRGVCSVLSNAGSATYAKDNEGRTPRQVALARSDYYIGDDLNDDESGGNWKKVSVLERKADGSLPDEKTATTYVYDNLTADLYRGEPSKLKFRAKSLMISALSPLFIVKTIGSNLIKIVSDIASAVWKSISNFSKADIKASFKNFAISIIWDAPAAALNRIYRAAKSPLFGIGMFFAGIYGLYHPKEGRKTMNKIETLWNETGLLETVGMKKVGNLASSKASPEYAKFLLTEWR